MTGPWPSQPEFSCPNTYVISMGNGVEQEEEYAKSVDSLLTVYEFYL